MPRQNREEAGKIRKRGCSSSASSSSSMIQNYRFKRAILVGKRCGSTTPLPTWKLIGGVKRNTPTLRGVDSPKYAASLNGSKGKQQLQQPVSARKLAATLWEMNEVPSPKVREVDDERRLRKERRGRDRAPPRSVRSGSFPPHLSDPSHSPASEMERSGTGSRRGRMSSMSQKLRLVEQTVGPYDSISNASLMEVETRSRCQTPSGSTVGVKTRLKDVSNALTTSKELLKIINRVWGNTDRPSSSMSLISALHAELERARLQVNQLIQEQRSDQNEIKHLMKCFAEEKASWRNQEQKVVEAAIESVAGELEVEKKLRRQFESLNKKLGKELAETKAALLKAVKELQTEKRTRVVMEQVCDELARDINEDKAEVEELKRESVKLSEEVDKEREMMQLADVLREERVQMKLSDAKYQLEEKNAAVDKLRNQLEAYIGSKRTKEKGRSSFSNMNDGEIASYFSKIHDTYYRHGPNNDDGEVDDGVECEVDSAESDLHSIDLNVADNSKSYKWAHLGGTPRDPRRAAIEEEETTGRKSSSSKVCRKKIDPLKRSVSDGVEWMNQSDRISVPQEGQERGRFSELERQKQGNGFENDTLEYQSVKGLRDYLYSASSRLESGRGYGSPLRPRSSRDTTNALQEKLSMLPGNAPRTRMAEPNRESLSARKSRWLADAGY